MARKRLNLNKGNEIFYLNKFSSWRYTLFLKIEKLYKKFINKKDGRLEIILNHIKQIKPKFILEIGSGTLIIYNFLPQAIKKNCQYYICEINPTKVKYITNKYPEIKVSCSSALDLPYQENNFDLVFSKGVIHHIDHQSRKQMIEQKIKFFEESYRVLKKGGSNLSMDVDYNPQCLSDFFWHYTHRLILREGEHNFSNLKEVENLFLQTGYKNISSGQFRTFKGVYYYVIGKK